MSDKRVGITRQEPWRHGLEMAKFLVFDEIPPLIEKEKDSQPHPPVAGAAIAQTELVKERIER
jgi:hypothetical protein